MGFIFNAHTILPFVSTDASFKPVLLSGTGAVKSGWLDTFGSLFILTLVFVGVVFLAYYTTRLIGRAKLRAGKNNNIQVLEGVSLGLNSNLFLVRAGDKYIMLGATKEHITYITELDSNTVKSENDKGQNTQPLAKLFENIIKKHNKS